MIYVLLSVAELDILVQALETRRAIIVVEIENSGGALDRLFATEELLQRVRKAKDARTDQL